MRSLDSDKLRTRVLRFAPIVLLVSVAVCHFVLVRTSHLSQWKGAGFGMFSTTDGGSSRCLHAFATTPEGVVTELKIPSTLIDLERRARELPSEARLKEIARKIMASPNAEVANAAGVRVEVWRAVFDKKNMQSHGELLRSFELRKQDVKR